MDYRLYLFDFDYTLANSEVGILRCFRLTLAHFARPCPDDVTLRRTIGLPMREAMGIAAGCQESAFLDDMLVYYRQQADKFMTDGTSFFPGALDTLRSLHGRGAKIGIVSSKTRCRINESFVRNQATDAIDLIVGSEDVATPKPDPSGLLMAVSHFGVGKKETLYVGDSYIDAQAAKNAGLDFAGVATGTTAAEELAAFPHVRVMRQIDELLL